jgi:hypothetical protein
MTEGYPRHDAHLIPPVADTTMDGTSLAVADAMKDGTSLVGAGLEATQPIASPMVECGQTSAEQSEGRRKLKG